MPPLERLCSSRLRFSLRSNSGLSLLAQHQIQCPDFPARTPVVLSQDGIECSHCLVDATLDVAITDELGDLTHFSCPPLGLPEHIGNASTEGGENLGLARRQFLKQRPCASGALGSKHHGGPQC